MGLGVCTVLVRSVSPRRLVLEVRSFPSPLRCFGLLPVIRVRFFLPLAFQDWPGSGRVCVCNIWIDVKLIKTSLFFFLLSSPFLIIITMQGDRALWCYSVQRSYASEREASTGHGCVPANMSNGLGWFARYRTQFLTDHYNDPVLV